MIYEYDEETSFKNCIDLGEPVSGKEASKLKERVMCVERRVDDTPPDWDDLPDESGDESEYVWEIVT